MAESDWFPIVVEFMSVTSLAALEGACRGMVAGHVASPLERVVRRLAVKSDVVDKGGWQVTWSRSMQHARVRVGQAKAAEGKGSVACGDRHSLVVSSGGNVHSFGDGVKGALGHGVETSEMVPRRIEALDRMRVVCVAAGGNHSMALTSDGDVYSWGWGMYGQLGHNDYTDRLLPTKVDALDNVSGIACGAVHSMALRRGEGSVFVWGFGYAGQLGLGDCENRLLPTMVPKLRGVLTVAAGCCHSLALEMDGTVAAWGYNKKGQLGLGDTEDRLSPTVVEGLR